MSALHVFVPPDASSLLRRMVEKTVGQTPFLRIQNDIALPDLRDKKLLIAVEISKAGFSMPAAQLITRLYDTGADSLSGASAVLLLHSPNEFYTKSMASNLVFLLNQLGCRFPGHPVIDATGSLMNFSTWQKTMDMSLEEICLENCSALGRRFLNEYPNQIKKPRILALHSSSSRTSNTLMLWNMVKKGLEGCEIQEFHVENGKVLDCIGCSFRTCIHFSKQHSCFYGGVMVEEIMPAIENSDAVVWICPNYNDAVSANLTAVMNRLTALYRRIPFYAKSMYAVIVSGNSGSDTLAKQLIGALCVNKGFSLPPRFCITATANDPGAIMHIPGVEASASDFARLLLTETRK